MVVHHTAVAALITVSAVHDVAAEISPPHSPVGRWHTIDDKDGKPRGIIEIIENNGSFEGRIAGTLRPNESIQATCERCPDERRGRKMMGLEILTGLKQQGRGASAVWTGGKILDPDSGKIYDVKLELADGGRTLNVRGYLGIALLGRTQRWKRAPLTMRRPAP
jgi:uncharacterized protein (DUF2147 family)